MLPPLSFSQTSLPNWEDALNQGVLFVFVSDLTVNESFTPPACLHRLRVAACVIKVIMSRVSLRVSDWEGRFLFIEYI